ncbi:MAG: hypothetical protein D3923_09345 [Candidatus Electrothrix sp. AR3]|nr:hypothetical protein [Candidatus Electrothrix sp. AR3]
MDAGIATEENITWLKENGYKYIVVSRKRKREFCEQEAIVVKRIGENTVKAQRKINEETSLPAGKQDQPCRGAERVRKPCRADRPGRRFGGLGKAGGTLCR